MNSHLTVCLARVNKHLKCKFVPRLLSMIVGDCLWEVVGTKTTWDQNFASLAYGNCRDSSDLTWEHLVFWRGGHNQRFDCLKVQSEVQC